MKPAASKFRTLSALMILCALGLYACTPGSAVVDSPTPEAGPPRLSVTLPAPFTATPAPTAPGPAGSPIFHGPLSVIITQPGENSTVSASPVIVRGQADPGTVLTIADEILLVGSDGQFQAQVALEPGPNLIEITASDAQENQDFAYLTVLYEP